MLKLKEVEVNLDVKLLKYYLSNNIDKLVDLLEKLEFSNIKVKDRELRCAREEGHNSSSIVIYLDSMLYHDYSKNLGGDIINLLENERSIGFKQALNEVVRILNLDESKVDTEAVKEWQTNKTSDAEEEVAEAKVYTKEEFIKEFEFEEGTNMRFLNDGISLSTQCEFELMYDEIYHRIIIPWRNKNGGFVGYNARYNGDDIADHVPKYLTMDGFSKGSLLYGMYENKKYLEDKGKVVYVFEAEKSVMKAYTAGIHNCVAVGSHNISSKQIELLKELNSKAVIIAFDEGLKELEIQKQSQRLKDEGVNAGYLFDANNEFLKKGSKDSPMDLGGEEFKAFVRDKSILRWI